MVNIFGMKITKAKGKKDIRNKIIDVPNISPKLTTSHDTFVEFNKGEYPTTDFLIDEIISKSSIMNLLFKIRTEEVFRSGTTIDIIENKGEDIIEKNKIINLLNSKNSKNSSLIVELKDFNRDLDKYSRGFLIKIKDYYIDKSGCLFEKFKEIRRIKPSIIKQIINKRGDLGKDEYDSTLYFSPMNRSETTTAEFDEKNKIKNLVADYCVMSEGEGEIFYNKSEILSVYINGGISYILYLKNKIEILNSIDIFLLNLYKEESDKPPKSLLFIPTNNYESLRVMWKKYLETVRENPSALHPIPINSGSENRKSVEFVDMSKSNQDNQLLEIIKDLENKLGAFYGVSPVFQNDTSAGTGLNNEGLQIKITDRAIEDRQKIINDEVLINIIDDINIKNYKLTINPSKEIDFVYKEQLLASKLQNAKSLLELGVNVRLNKDDSLKYDETDLELANNEMQDGFTDEQESEENEQGTLLKDNEDLGV